MKLVIGAMREELEELITTLKAEKMGDEIVDVYFSEQANVLVAITGIGTVNASLGLSYVLTKYGQVELVINIGTSGTTNQEKKQGDLLIIDQATYLKVDATGFGYQYGQVPQMPVSYQVSQALLSQTFSQLEKFKPIKANLATSDSFINDQALIADDLAKLPVEVTVFDMEGTAYFQTAFSFNKPFVSLKIVSDVLGSDGTNEQQFDQFLGDAAKKISKVIQAII